MTIRRIAVIAPPFFLIPPVYGGVEEVVTNLLKGLVARVGLQHEYEIVLFAAQGSAGVRGVQTVYLSAPFLPVKSPEWEGPVAWAAADEANTALAYRMIYSGRYGKFDLISDHTVPGPAMSYAMSGREGFVPTLVTLHNTLPSRYLPALLSEFPTHAPLAYAAIARHELQAAQEMGIAPIYLCYNGEDIEQFISVARNVQQEDYFSFIARIHPDKDVVRVCRLALQAGVKLKLAGRINDQRYFHEDVEPLLEAYPEQLVYVGEISPETKAEFLAKSLGFIFTVSWREGFGMSVVQAWSCGLPVIGTRKGSLIELLDPAPAAGIATDSDAAMVEAIQAIANSTGRFSREACFSRARDFSIESMTKAYENAFNVLLNWD
jgi:glycosyltransferase involved in cell wall biosynthesis